MNKIIIVALVCLIVAGGAGFFVGRNSFSAMNNSYQMNGGSGGNTQRGQGRFFGGRNGQAVRGKVINSDNNSITVQSNDGTSTIVVVSGSTNYYKSASASKNDINNGDTVMVFGQKNSDGSVTAQMVQLNPIGRMQSGSSPTPSQ